MFVDTLQIFNAAVFGRFKKDGQPLKIAVIGNSGYSSEDLPFIEGADCIIRFNNYATREGIEHHHFGCDILFTTGDLHSSDADPSIVVIGIPYPFKVDQGIIERLTRWYPKARAYMVNPYWNNELCKELKIPSQGHAHPLPSIGMTFLWHLFRLICIVPTFSPSVFITGFSFYADKEKRTIQGWNMKDAKYPTHWNHNYPKEVRWMIANLMNRNDFSFGKETFEILQWVKDQIS